jgi:predicted phage tail protein
MAELINNDIRPTLGNPTPEEYENSLQSKQFATVIDLLGYGEIHSSLDDRNIITDGNLRGEGNLLQTTINKDFQNNVFLEGTPLINDNGEKNFADVQIEYKSGFSNQSPSQLIDEIQKVNTVGVEVPHGTPITRSIDNTNVDKVRVTLQIPILQKVDTDSNEITGTSIGVSIKIKENNGNEVDFVPKDVIVGRVTSPYLKDYEIKFTRDMDFPISITVERLFEENPKYQRRVNWLSFTEITTDKRAYEGFAYVAVRFNAQQFQSFPKRMYRVKGTKILVPNGTTIDSDNGRVVYPENYIFDGTFKTVEANDLVFGTVDGNLKKEWCSDPAWILYDILTTDKGFGGENGIIDPDTLDVYSFFAASKYSSELITDPITGTQEPRFSCNVVLNQKNDAYSLINDLCSVMNAMPFYSNGSLQLSQDRPTNTTTKTSDPQYIFNNSNVTEEGFTYQGVGQRIKYTEVEVAYFDNDTQEIDFELVTTEDIKAFAEPDEHNPNALDAKNKYGSTRKTLKAFACTSRGQANRLGRWFLYSNLKESEVVSFTTTLEAGVIVRPATIIAIADSLRAGVRRGGRIKSATSTTIVVDDANNTDLTTENSATLTVILPNGKASVPRTISSINGTTITVSSAFAYKDDDGNEVTATPQANSIWAIENSSIELQIFRVVSIEEKNESEYTITAVIHDTNKYAEVESLDVALNPRTITTLIDEKPSPNNLSATEQIVQLDNRAISKIFVTWEPVQGVNEYLVFFRYSDGDVDDDGDEGIENPESFRISRPSFEIVESRAGKYEFTVQSYNALGKLSSSVSKLVFNAVGKTAVPADVQNVQIEPISDQSIRLSFDKSTDVDVLHGGTLIIRSSNLTTGASFTDSVDVGEFAGNVNSVIVDNIINGTYFLAFKDDGGRISANAASIKNISTQPDVQPKLTVLTDREDLDSTPFAGSKVGCFFDSTLDGLVHGLNGKIDGVSDFDAIEDLDLLDNTVATVGTYSFANTLDLGGKQPLVLQRHLVTKGFYNNELFDDRSAFIETWTDFDGTTVAIDVNAKVLVATTDSDPDTSTAGTYTINNGSGAAGTIITITKSGHGYSVGSFVTVDFTSGTGVDGDYQIQSITTNTFTLTSATSLSTSGNCNFSAEFSQFNPFINGKYIARGFKFRCDLETKDIAQSIEIEELGYTAQIESRTETSLGNAGATNGVFASGTSTKSVTFTNSFFTGQSGTSVAANSVLPSIGITIENQSQGDFFVLSNITGSGFDIDVKDSNGNNVNRNFKYAVTGFGRGS